MTNTPDELEHRIDSIETSRSHTRTLGLLLLVAFLGVVAGATFFPRDGGGRKFVDGDPTEEPASARCPGGSPQTKGRLALDRVNYPWQDLNYSVEFLPGKRGYLAITFTGPKRIEMYVRRCQSVDSVANTLAHEFGHALDDRYVTDAERGEYLAIRGKGPEWFPCNRCSDYASGAGDFAEVFAFLKSPPGRFRSKVAPPPDEAQAQLIERFYMPDAATTTTTVPTTTTTCTSVAGLFC